MQASEALDVEFFFKIKNSTHSLHTTLLIELGILKEIWLIRKFWNFDSYLPLNFASNFIMEIREYEIYLKNE